MAEPDDTDVIAERAADGAAWRVDVLGPIRSAHTLRAGRSVVGRSPTAAIAVAHDSISREHAAFEVGAEATIADLGSRNGTFVDGRRLAPHVPCRLRGDSVVRVGAVAMVVTQAHARPEQSLTRHQFDEVVRRETTAARREGELGVVMLRFATGPLPIEDAAACLGALAVAAISDRELYALVDGGVAGVEQRVAELRRWLDANRHEARIHVEYHPRPREAVAGRVVVDPVMAQLHMEAARFAAGSISVLIVGETGVGKEVFAEAIWLASPRATGRFVRVNCAALTESLLESELFGHERGAFSGALTAKAGLLEEASGGTLLLDEIGELSLAAQAKLLRCLEDKQVTRVGGLKPRPVDVRFVAATNRRLEADVERGAFRRDLYFRLAGAVLEIPALRTRRAEIIPLARAFLTVAAQELDVEAPLLSLESTRVLESYAWPGNIRELRNAVGRAMLLADHVIEPRHLPPAIRDAAVPHSEPHRAPPPTAPASAPGGGTADPRSDERDRLLRALADHGGNQTEAAAALGISRVTLAKWLVKHAIPRPRKKLR